MRAERAFAWAVLYAGIATMIATSDTDGDDDPYGVWEYTSATAQLHSEGPDDAKIARLTIVRSGALRDMRGDLNLRVAAKASRPAADLVFGLLHDAVDSQDGGVAPDAGSAQVLDGGIDAGTAGRRDMTGVAVPGTYRPKTGFTELELQGSMSISPCGEVAVCSTVREVYVRAQAPEPFSLELMANASFGSYSGYVPLDAGGAEDELTMTIEVVDAP